MTTARAAWPARIALALLACSLVAAEAEERPNGFEITRHRVDRTKILAGGPSRDGIPPVDAPTFADLEQATWVAPDTPVLGVASGGEARAYPVHLIERHQVVNDEIGGTPVAVTFDPLAGSPLAFDRRVDGRTLRFGVSGLIYNSNFLLYDRETESLWSQFNGEAISGPLSGKRLTRLPVRQEDMATWTGRHPDTRVLERPDRRGIDYRYSPYTRYRQEDDVSFPVEAVDRRFHAKEIAVGVEVDGKRRAYLGSIVTAAGGSVQDEFHGKKIRLEYSSDLAVFRYEVDPGVELTEAYWFAWKAFHPDTDVWKDPGEVPGRKP